MMPGSLVGPARVCAAALSAPTLTPSIEGFGGGRSTFATISATNGSPLCGQREITQKGEKLASRRFHARVLRAGVAALAVLAVSALSLQHAGRSRGASAVATQASSQVVVIPGFTAPKYPGFFGVPTFPAGVSQLSAYHFSQLPTNQVTPSALSSYDTAILYGLRWSDIPASGQAAINAFAATHKVLIWDADGTGSQNYSTFIHPFSDLSSGEDNTNPKASVVSFPQTGNFLASDKSSSPYYLDPNQLVSDRDEINHMNAMTTGTANWVPALVAANSKIPNGGWPLAWSYGVIGNHTGMTIYSGIDADAFGDTKLNPNNAIKELALQLQAQFRVTPDPACAPGCKLGDSGGGSGSGSGGGSSGGPPHAACSIEKAPQRWVHGRVPVVLKTSEAAGITGRVLSPTGRIVAAAKESGDLIRFRVNTKPLRSNHGSRLRALVYVNGQQACSTSFRLRVDNTPPRLLSLRTWTLGHTHLVSLRVSEKSAMRITGAGHKYSRSVLIAPHKLIRAKLGGSVHHARLILRDRAGNTVRRTLAW